MGVMPAWRLSRADVRTLLNESTRNTSSGVATSRVMSGLIVAEIALAIALVAGAGWLVQSFSRLRAVDPGFVPAGRLVVDVRLDANVHRPEGRIRILGRPVQPHPYGRAGREGRRRCEHPSAW